MVSFLLWRNVISSFNFSLPSSSQGVVFKKNHFLHYFVFPIWAYGIKKEGAIEMLWPRLNFNVLFGSSVRKWGDVEETDWFIVYFGWKREGGMWRLVCPHLHLSPVIPWVSFCLPLSGSTARGEYIRRRILTEMLQELKRCQTEQNDWQVDDIQYPLCSAFFFKKRKVAN